MAHRILIIGGTGFIGSAIAARLSKEGHDVHVLARHAPSIRHHGIQYWQGSIDNVDMIRELVTESRTIIHAASTTTPGVSANQPTLELTQNVLPTLRLLEVIQDVGPRHVIYFSSGGALYGSPQHVPVEEHHCPAPISNYGAGKVAVEAFLSALAQRGRLTATILRPSNVYGEGQILKPGFGIIRTILEHALRGTTMEIWGDGSIVRDFVHIDDVTAACSVLVANHRIDGVFNLGSGVGYNQIQLIEVVKSVCGIDLPLTFRERRDIDVQCIVLSAGKLRDAIGWHPKIGIEEGIDRTWKSLIQS